jgi:hypothetical protein
MHKIDVSSIYIYIYIGHCYSLAAHPCARAPSRGVRSARSGFSSTRLAASAPHVPSWSGGFLLCAVFFLFVREFATLRTCHQVVVSTEFEESVKHKSYGISKNIPEVVGRRWMADLNKA